MINYTENLYCSILTNSVSGIAVKGIARWDGENWDSVTAGISGIVRFQVVENDDLIIVGDFDTFINGAESHSIAKWYGTNWSSFSSEVFFQKASINTAVKFNNEWYFGGNIFVFSSGVYYHDIFKFSNGVWSPAANGLKGNSGGVFTSAIYRDELYIGGLILKSEGNEGRGILKLQNGQ
jgi:hypothetical protein